MSEALYERYKDALRRGHVASLRGRHDAALAAYVEAATIAPERALPHASIGSVYLRLGRPSDALTAFDKSLDRSPADEASLAGRADALALLGKPAEAAVTLDRLSSILEAAGRTVEALDSARRALELAESRPRRGVVEALAERLRDTDPDAPGRASLAEALRLLERTAVVAPDEAETPAGDGPATEEPGSPEPGSPEPEPDPLALLAAAIAAVDAGDTEVGRSDLLRAAVLLDRSGRPDAAIDACYEALALAPADPELHLALVDLYLERGWNALAAEKLALLGRLADLGEDATTAERVRGLASARVADEPRIRDLLA